MDTCLITDDYDREVLIQSQPHLKSKSILELCLCLK